ncbi:hypothetical protein VKT23_012925 [Stygiomarasmius scandens]|uniref:Uncharacterized protein n=1 Tax=Marasmiellus scandens TaxID=2682957 RepID=A0ABR1J5E6_9AGAR
MNTPRYPAPRAVRYAKARDSESQPKKGLYGNVPRRPTEHDPREDSPCASQRRASPFPPLERRSPSPSPHSSRPSPNLFPSPAGHLPTPSLTPSNPNGRHVSAEIPRPGQTSQTRTDTPPAGPRYIMTDHSSPSKKKKKAKNTDIVTPRKPKSSIRSVSTPLPTPTCTPSSIERRKQILMYPDLSHSTIDRHRFSGDWMTEFNKKYPHNNEETKRLYWLLTKMHLDEKTLISGTGYEATCRGCGRKIQLGSEAAGDKKFMLKNYIDHANQACLTTDSKKSRRSGKD